jgi:hypothetical protein
MRGVSVFWSKSGFPAFALLALVGGLGLLGYSFWAGRAYWPLSIDYSDLYVAGRLWNETISPYGDALPLAAQNIIHRDLLPFAYPPNWYAPARLLALFDPATSNVLRFGLSGAMLVASAWLMAGAVLHFRPAFTPLARAIAPVEADRRGKLLLAALFAGFFAATKGAGADAYLGQTGALVLFGHALVINGAIGKKQARIVTGLVILLLKPTVGVAYASALLFDRRTRLSAIIALAVSGVLALPGLLIGGPIDVMRQYMAGVAAFGGSIENMPDATSGFGNLLWRATGVRLSAFQWLDIANIIGIAGGLLLRRRLGEENGPLALILAITLAVGVFVPLHDWDFLLFAPFVGLLVFLDGWALALALAATLLLTRLAGALEQLASQDAWLSHQSISAATGTIAILLALAASIVATRRPGQPIGRAMSTTSN